MFAPVLIRSTARARRESGRRVVLVGTGRRGRVLPTAYVTDATAVATREAGSYHHEQRWAGNVQTREMAIKSQSTQPARGQPNQLRVEQLEEEEP